MKQLFFGLAMLPFLLASCNDGKNTNVNTSPPSDLSSFKGNSYSMKIDKSVKHPADIQFPSQELKEEDYLPADTANLYNITFSEDGESVSIEPGTMSGKKSKGDDASLSFDLNEGTFAGGRFVVFKKDKGLRAELTIYGSGVPIITSERGALDVKKD